MPTTGCSGSENIGSDQKSGAWRWVSSTKILYSLLVSGNFPMAKPSSRTRWRGISFSGPFSLPMRNEPSGMTTVSGLNLMVTIASNEDGKRLETPDSFYGQLTIIPFQHPALEVRDMLEAETGEHSCRRSAEHAAATNRDAMRVLLSIQLTQARS